MEKPFKQCACFSPEDRPKCPEIVQLFRASKQGSLCRDIPLSVSQTTAVDHHDNLVAVGATSLNADIPNDAINSCSFLSVIITDLFVEEGTKVGLAQNRQHNHYHARTVQPISKHREDVRRVGGLCHIAQCRDCAEKVWTERRNHHSSCGFLEDRERGPPQSCPLDINRPQ